MIRSILLRWAALLYLAQLLAAAVTSDPQVDIILKDNCAPCHSGKSAASGFRVDTNEAILNGGNKHGQAVVPGNPDASPLLQMIRGNLEPRMPMGARLSPEQMSRIEIWIQSMPAAKTQQAAASNWKPFERPTRPAVPAVRNTSWVQNPIDAFILKTIEANSLQPAPAASRRTLARRLFLDLVGVPPTPAEMDAFLSDSTPEGYAKWVDRLLADPRYGQRWGRHWLDLARYGETSGLEGDGAIGNVWRYRDWVIDAFNSNMPYDSFVQLQIGGADEHSKTRNNYQPDPQSYIPTAFLRVAPWDRSNLVAAEVRANYLGEVTTATSSVFLGLTVGCARCHDHKYDPIPQKDFYRFQAFFNATQAGGSVAVPYEDEAMAERANSEIRKLEQRIKSGPEQKALDELEKSMLPKLIAARKAHADNKTFVTNDLRLELRLKTPRIFTPADVKLHARLLADAERTQDPDEEKPLLELEKRLQATLEAAYRGGQHDPNGRFDALSLNEVRSELRNTKPKYVVFTTAEKDRHADLSGQVEILRRRLDRWQPNVLAVTNVPGPPSGPDIAPTRVLIRGDYRQPGDAVEPGFPSALTGNSKPAAIETDRYRQFPTRGHRITLARWLASKDNPLTARVMVNRIWQQHFGTGIVSTTSDFGKNGAKPTHPELLDWLAVEFMESGWDIKHLHRLMLLSNTFRQAADNPTGSGALFSRYERRRLEAEAIRDSILHASGRLNTQMGGPSVFPALPADLADFARYGRTGDVMWEPNEANSDELRRSVYIFQRRSLPLPMMAAFDAIVFSESCERRSSTTTPLQALSLMNGSLVHDEAAHLAKKITNEANRTPRQQIDRAFQFALNRPPAADELERFAASGMNLESLCRVLLTSNEFIYVE